MAILLTFQMWNAKCVLVPYQFVAWQYFVGVGLCFLLPLSAIHRALLLMPLLCLIMVCVLTSGIHAVVC